MNNLGDKIRQIRIARGYTQEDVAELMQVKRTAVSNWEKNLRTPSSDKLIEYAKLMKVTLDYFNDAPPERTMFQLMAQLDGVFNDANISDSDKDKAYQDIMEIYLNSKKKARNTSPASEVKDLLDLKEE